jgi:hypothetical protein
VDANFSMHRDPSVQTMNQFGIPPPRRGHETVAAMRLPTPFRRVAAAVRRLRADLEDPSRVKRILSGFTLQLEVNVFLTTLRFWRRPPCLPFRVNFNARQRRQGDREVRAAG